MVRIEIVRIRRVYVGHRVTHFIELIFTQQNKKDNKEIIQAEIKI